MSGREIGVVHWIARRVGTALGARDIESEAERQALEAEVLPQVGRVPIREIEQRIDADKIDYRGTSPYYSGPKSWSGLIKQEWRRSRAISRILGTSE